MVMAGQIFVDSQLVIKSGEIHRVDSKVKVKSLNSHMGFKRFFKAYSCN